MAVFAVIAYSEPLRLKQAVVEQCGANQYELTPGCWFVVDDGTTKLVADKLGLTDGKIGAQGVVPLFTGYSGWGPRAAWDWLQNAKSAAPNG
jgi:hypothetical protein